MILKKMKVLPVFIFVMFTMLCSSTQIATEETQKPKLSIEELNATKTILKTLQVAYEPIRNQYKTALCNYNLGKGKLGDVNAALIREYKFFRNEEIFLQLKNTYSKLSSSELKKRMRYWHNLFLPYQGSESIVKTIKKYEIEALQLYKKYNVINNNSEKNAFLQLLGDVLKKLYILRDKQAKELGYSNYYDMKLFVNDIDKDELSNCIKLIRRKTDKTYKYNFSTDRFKEARKRLKGLNRIFSKAFQKRELENILFEYELPFDRKRILLLTKEPENSSVVPNVEWIKIPGKSLLYIQPSNGYHNFRKLLKSFTEAIYFTSIKQDIFEFNIPNKVLKEAFCNIMYLSLFDKYYLSKRFPVNKKYEVKNLVNSIKMSRLMELRKLLLNCDFEELICSYPNKANYDELWYFAQWKHLNGTIRTKYKWVLTLYESYFDPYFNKLLGHVASAQLLVYFQSENGLTWVKPEVGTLLLKKIIEIGSSEDWKSAIKEITGKKVSPDNLLKITTIDLPIANRED